MMSIKSVKIPGVGMRNVKTALAAAFCAFIYAKGKPAYENSVCFKRMRTF